MNAKLIIATILFGFKISAQNNQTVEALFIGNSYTAVNDLPQLIAQLANASNDVLLYQSNCPGGATFQTHCTNGTSINMINSQNWDVVILQAQSQEPAFPPAQVAQQTLPFALILDSIIHQNDSCTKTIFYETWGRKYGDVANCPFYPPICTYTGMQDRLKASYKLFADTCQAILAPAGEAWRQSIALDSSLNLYQSDNSHPSMEGSYLTACVFYEVIFNKSVVNNSFLASVDTAVALALQQIAHTVVTDSSSVWNIGAFNPCGGTASTPNLMMQELTSYPNPVNSELIVSVVENELVAGISYRISNALGKEVAAGNMNTNTISVDQLPKGIYYVQFHSATINSSVKFVKE
jgi:hypothetical protein